MYISLGMNLINLVGDYIGVHVLQAGVAGVAVPTLLSRAFAAVVMTVLAFRPGKAVRLRWSHIFAWDAGEIRRLLHIAVPGGGENGLFALGKVLMVSIVSHFGTVQIAANGVAGSIDQIAVMVVNAVNLAIVPVVGRCVGAGEEGAGPSLYQKAHGDLLLVFGGLGPWRLPAAAGAVAPLPAGARDFAPGRCAHSFAQPDGPGAAPHLVQPAQQPAGGRNVRYTMWVGVGSMVVFRLGSALLLGVALGLGILGVWIAMGLDWLARSVAFGIRYKSGKWKEMCVI